MLVGKRKTKRERRKKEGKQEREAGREGEEGREGKKEERNGGGEKRKIPLCPIRILSASHHSNSCQQSTHDLDIAKSRGHSQSSAYFIPQQNFIL